jgi:hypothetical protein
LTVSAHSVREGEIDPSQGTMAVRLVGFGLIIFAVAFNLPYAWLASNFDYPGILRSPPGVILEAFAAGGAPLILAWATFALAALLFAPVAVAMAKVTRRKGHASSAVAALGVAAGVTQAIGLSRWVYAVPGLAAGWVASAADPGLRSSIEASFTTLHQFAGVGIGEAIGQSLTAFWLIGVAVGQRRNPRFGRGPAALGVIGGIVLLLGLVEGLATVMAFDPGGFGLAAVLGYLLLTVWMIWTGLLCILRPATGA